MKRFHEPNTICETCGKEFYRRPSRLEKYSRHFCSAPCWWRWQKQNWRGEKHPSWTGGRMIDKTGYIQVQGFGEFPEMENLGGYVREHRLLVARKLGRALEPGEIIHHLNGIPDDNRPENLALRTRRNHERATRPKLYQARIRELEATERVRDVEHWRPVWRS